MKKLSFFDRYLTVWIFAAMALGIVSGKLFPGLSSLLDRFQVGSVNIPIAVGLILMMFPPLAKVHYRLLPSVFRNVRLLVTAFLLIWVLAPLVMFGLAAAFFPSEGAYFTGLVLIGIAPCIAMVLVWNDLADGDRQYAAALVAVNSLMQLLLYPVFARFYLFYLPNFLGLNAVATDISYGLIAGTVLIYMGIPFLLGFLSRTFLAPRIGEDKYESQFLPDISPLTPAALLFTIGVMFGLKAELFFRLPGDMLRISVPLAIYFGVMFFGSWAVARSLNLPYPEKTALSFTAAGNNFELALAVAIGVFGLNSGQAFAAVIGPLIEVPALILLVRFALRFREKK